jgi:hypothetical protein
MLRAQEKTWVGLGVPPELDRLAKIYLSCPYTAAAQNRPGKGGRKCVAATQFMRSSALMSSKHVRFEVPLSPDRYGELERLSERIGICPRDVARLAIARLLENSVLGRAEPVRTGATA